MSIFRKSLPSCASLACMPQVARSLSIPTALGVIVSAVLAAPKLIKQGQEVVNAYKTATNLISEQIQKQKEEKQTQGGNAEMG